MSEHLGLLHFWEHADFVIKGVAFVLLVTACVLPERDPDKERPPRRPGARPAGLRRHHRSAVDGAGPRPAPVRPGSPAVPYDDGMVEAGTENTSQPLSSGHFLMCFSVAGPLSASAPSPSPRVLHRITGNGPLCAMPSRDRSLQTEPVIATIPHICHRVYVGQSNA